MLIGENLRVYETTSLRELFQDEPRSNFPLSFFVLLWIEVQYFSAFSHSLPFSISFLSSIFDENGPALCGQSLLALPRCQSYWSSPSQPYHVASAHLKDVRIVDPREICPRVVASQMYPTPSSSVRTASYLQLGGMGMIMHTC